jgi:SNF2 family DNA or RNA helicase
MSDSDFDLSSTTNEEVDTIVAQLKSEIDMLDLELDDNAINTAKIRKEIDPFTAQEREIIAKLAEITKAKRKHQAELDRIAKENRAKVEEQNAKQRRLQAFLSEKAIRDEFERFSRSLDENTIGAPWREFAYEHQLDGGRRLASAHRAILGDKRGLGKTLTSIITIDMLAAKKVLVMVPRDVGANFARELKTWTPKRVVLNMIGQKKSYRDNMYPIIQDAEKVLVILNYEAWVRDKSLIERLIDMRFDTVIIDEAHNIKNIKGNGFEGIREIVYAANKCPSCSGTDIEPKTQPGEYIPRMQCNTCLYAQVGDTDFCSVANVIPMSGTTILNRPQDIWPLLNLLDRKLFGSVHTFLRDYAQQNGNRWVFRPGGQERLIKRLGARYIGRTPDTAGVKFPPQAHILHSLQLDPKVYPNQYKVLRQIYEYGAIKMAEDKVMKMPFKIAEITRRRQAMVWPAGIQLKDADGNVVLKLDCHESIKMDKTLSLVDEIVEQEGDRVVVFSKFKEALKEAERRCKEAGYRVVRYDGDMSQELRDEVQMDFDIKEVRKRNGQYRWDVLLAQYDSASTGLNLTGARQMILMDRNWSPGREDQAEGRIQRLDSDKDSIVHILEVDTMDYERGLHGRGVGIDEFMALTFAYKKQNIDGFEDANNESEELFKRLMGDG